MLAGKGTFKRGLRRNRGTGAYNHCPRNTEKNGLSELEKRYDNDPHTRAFGSRKNISHPSFARSARARTVANASVFPSHRAAIPRAQT